jgi:DnaJ-domain-containing protein 1
MGFWRSLWRRVLGDEPTKVPWMDQHAREALVDVLVLAMLIDGSPHADEWDELRREVERLGWRSDKPWELYLSEAAERAERVRHLPDARRAWCADIAQRLPSLAQREHALREVALLMRSDGSFDDPERDLARLLAELFGISPERLAELLDEASAGSE